MFVLVNIDCFIDKNNEGTINAQSLKIEFRSFEVKLPKLKEYLSDKNPRVIEIPPGVYHGYKALQPESIMLYYLTERYDPSDEWKAPPGHFGESWET